jgi:hypothetical protein
VFRFDVEYGRSSKQPGLVSNKRRLQAQRLHAKEYEGPQQDEIMAIAADIYG